jgi:hypothetical protein
MQKIKTNNEYFVSIFLVSEMFLPNFENILKKCLFKMFLKNVSSTTIHPKLSHQGLQIDVMLTFKSCEPN